MKFGHPLFQILKHFLVLVQPLPEHRVVNGLTSRHNKPGVVLCNFHDEARAVFVEMVLLHPAEEVCSAHACQHKAVFYLTVTYLPRCK